MSPASPSPPPGGAQAAAKRGPFVPRTVLPGDDVTDLILSHASLPKRRQGQQNLPKLGTGLIYRPHVPRSDDESKPSRGEILATRAGQIIHRPPQAYLVRTSIAKRYIPKLHDRILCIIEEKLSGGSAGGGEDCYRVNTFGSQPGLLPVLAFEGATKRNRPYLHAGALVYARVVRADVDVDPVLSCRVGGDESSSSATSSLVDGGASRKDWMTSEGTYGELRGGTMVRISLGLARQLLQPSNVVLHELGVVHKLAFEVAIGVNGTLWVHSTRGDRTIVVVNAIKNSEVLGVEETKGMVKALVKTLRSAISDEG